MICASTTSQTGQSIFGIVYPTEWSCLTQLTLLKINLINFGKTNLLHAILKLKFKEPEAEVGIRCYYSY